MAHLLADRVQELTTAGFAGTGAVQLNGVPANPAGRVTFSAGIGNGNETVFLVDDNAGNWEISVGILTSGAPDHLSRDTVLASSADGAKVNFTAGVKDVKVVASAQRLLMVDSSGKVIDGQGNTLPSMTLQVFTSNGVYTPPAGLRSLLVMVCGGGGGGGGSVGAGSGASAGNGGAGGEFAIKRIAATSLGPTEAVTIGAGGGGGAAGNNSGANGAATSFGAHVSAAGGNGGQSFNTNPSDVANGQASLGGTGGMGGDIQFRGAPGGVGIRLGSTSHGISGQGGSGPFGGGGRAVHNAGGSSGDSGTGSGGAGAHSTINSFAGGDGSSGFCIALESY